MKKITLIIVLTLFSTSILSQNTNIEFGLKSGINFSKYEYRGSNDLFKAKAGFYLGGFMNLMFSDIISLQPELIFASQETNSSLGQRETADQDLLYFTTDVTESTIILPIMLQLYPTENFYFEFGPQLGLILARNEKVTNNPFDIITANGNCLNCDKLDFGAALGIGYDLTKNFGINVRYFKGLIRRNFFGKTSVLNIGVYYKI